MSNVPLSDFSPFYHVFVRFLNPSYLRPEQAYLDLLKAGGKTSEDAATKIFDQLKPIEPSFLIGEWEGGDFDTGHPATEALKAIKWRGKIFHSEEDVEPIIVSGEGGKRTALVEYGRGRVCKPTFESSAKASTSTSPDSRSQISRCSFCLIGVRR
jgi:hypothetical protein